MIHQDAFALIGTGGLAASRLPDLTDLHDIRPNSDSRLEIERGESAHHVPGVHVRIAFLRRLLRMNAPETRNELASINASLVGASSFRIAMLSPSHARPLAESSWLIGGDRSIREQFHAIFNEEP
jgi:hypothetical protein